MISTPNLVVHSARRGRKPAPFVFPNDVLVLVADTRGTTNCGPHGAQVHFLAPSYLYALMHLGSGPNLGKRAFSTPSPKQLQCRPFEPYMAIISERDHVACTGRYMLAMAQQNHKAHHIMFHLLREYDRREEPPLFRYRSYLRERGEHRVVPYLTFINPQ